MASPILFSVPANRAHLLPAGRGVYRILNMANGKQYIGSSGNMKRRALSHRSQLRRGKHYNRHLQFAWDKYGEAAFAWEVVEVIASEEVLVVAEQRYIDILRGQSGHLCYNLMADAVRHMPGEETRRKMSESHKGQKAWNRGIPCPEHVKRINSEFHRGRPRSPATCAKLSAALLKGNHQYRGRHLPAPLKRKISAAQHKTGPKAGRFKGVNFDRRTQTYSARIYVSGRQLFLGRYPTEEQAAQAYNDAALLYFGPGCYLNSVEGARPVRRTTIGRPPKGETGLAST